MDVMLPKGTRDFGPQEKIARDKLTNLLKQKFELFGFNPIETPLLERFDVLSAKYAGGAEILKETFRLTDQGERELGLRYDLTVPLARYVAMNPNVKLPFKRYAIDRVFRDGPIKLGRYREFYQCDCDIVGANSAAADTQCVQLSLAIFEEIKLPFRIDINNVALLKRMLLTDGCADDKLVEAMLIIDKFKKIGESGVIAELETAGVSSACTRRILAIAELRSNDEKIKMIAQAYGAGPDLERIEEILLIAKDERVNFDPALSRGLSYYTGTVFETYVLGSAVTSAAAAGGRYDNMIGNFCERPGEYPAVGISFGLEPIMEAIKEKGLENKQTVSDVYVIPIKTPFESNEVVQFLRAANINADIDIMSRSISKNLDYASASNIPFVIFVGKKELDEGMVKIRDMKTGNEELLSKEMAVEKLHDYMKKIV